LSTAIPNPVTIARFHPQAVDYGDGLRESRRFIGAATVKLLADSARSPKPRYPPANNINNPI
jgi:hypothetical protein